MKSFGQYSSFLQDEYNNCFQSVVPGLVASVSLGNYLEM